MAAALKNAAGQGPESVRTYINANVVTIVVERSLTQVESAMAVAAAELTKQFRLEVQAAVRKQLIPEVESFTGQRVLACLSDHAIEPDVGIYTFVLDETE